MNSLRICSTWLAIVVAGCGGGRAASTAPPGPPIVAEPARTLGPVADECGALVDGLTRLAACTTDADRAADLIAWRDRAAIDARGAAHPDVPPEDQAATALACRTAREAIDAGIARCGR